MLHSKLLFIIELFVYWLNTVSFITLYVTLYVVWFNKDMKDHSIHAENQEIGSFTCIYIETLLL